MPKTKSVALDTQKKPHIRYKKVILASLLIVVIMLLVGISVFFYTKYSTTQALLKNFGQEQDKVGGIVTKVGKHYELPKTEQVTLATVSDITKLQGQPFFAKAQNNDKVLIYEKIGLAILYREKIDRIINVGPINMQPQPSVDISPSAVSVPVPVAIYNGTKTSGLAKKLEERLKDFSSVKTDVVLKSNSVNDYEESVVVDLSGKNMQAAKNIAGFVKGKIVNLPAGETKPSGADLLIILGRSYDDTTSIQTPNN